MSRTAGDPRLREQCCAQGAMGCCQSTEPETSTFHYVTVDLRYRRPIISIIPWNPPTPACASCGDQPQCGIELPNVEVTLLEQEETRTVLLVSFEVGWLNL